MIIFNVSCVALEWRATERSDLRPKSGAAPVLHCTSYVEIPNVQGQKNPSKMVGTGVAVRRHPMSKGKGEDPARC